MKKVKGLFALWFGMILLVAAAPAWAQGGNKLLLLYSDSDSNASSLKTALVGTGKFTAAQIDLFSMLASGTPSTAVLQGYQCVYAWTNFPAPDPVLAGDRLKTYVQGGGKLALFTYGISRPSSPWKFQGGIMGAGFNPLALVDTSLTTFPRTLDFSTALTSHPILSGVSEFTYGGNSNYAQVTLDPGATLIAKDNAGVPLIGLNAAGNVAAINLFPPPAGFTLSPGVIRTMANVCDAISFDVCLKDPRTGTLMQASSTTGTYSFTQCGTGASVFGQAGIRMAMPDGCTMLFADVQGGRAMKASFNKCQQTGVGGISVSNPPNFFFVNDITPGAAGCTCP